jgi:hypothetical protein
VRNQSPDYHRIAVCLCSEFNRSGHRCSAERSVTPHGKQSTCIGEPTASIDTQTPCLAQVRGTQGAIRPQPRLGVHLAANYTNSVPLWAFIQQSGPVDWSSTFQAVRVTPNCNCHAFQSSAAGILFTACCPGTWPGPFRPSLHNRKQSNILERVSLNSPSPTASCLKRDSEYLPLATCPLHRNRVPAVVSETQKPLGDPSTAGARDSQPRNPPTHLTPLADLKAVWSHGPHSRKEGEGQLEYYCTRFTRKRRGKKQSSTCSILPSKDPYIQINQDSLHPTFITHIQD